MAVVPDADLYLDQVVTAVATVLRASTKFMHSSGLPSGTGKVRRADEYDAFIPLVDTEEAIFCGVFVGGDKPGRTETAVRQERYVDVAILVTGKTTVGQEQKARTGRPTLWRNCARMASVAFNACAKEVHGTGGRFDGLSSIADDAGTRFDEQYDEDQKQFTLRVTRVLRLRIILNVTGGV